MKHHGVPVREFPSPASGLATPPELAGRQARPAHEGAREMGLIGVPEVQRDLDDLAGWILEHPLRNVATGPRDDARVCQTFFGETTLERPRTQLQHLRDGTDLRVAIAEQSDDQLLHDVAEAAGFAPSPHRSRLPTSRKQFGGRCAGIAIHQLLLTVASGARGPQSELLNPGEPTGFGDEVEPQRRAGGRRVHEREQLLVPS